MRYLVLSLIIALSACLPGAPDYPTSDDAAGAIARAGYFGPIDERYDADIFRAHPNVREFVRSVSCRARQDDSVACVVEIAGASQPHDLTFCRCGGGGFREWSVVSEFDDPNLPKIAYPSPTEAEFRASMRAHRARALERARDMNNGDDHALQEMKRFYRRLSASERVFAVNELSAWLLDSDSLLRDQTLQMIDELRIHGTEPALASLLTRLSQESAAPDVLERVTRVQRNLADPNRRSF